MSILSEKFNKKLNKKTGKNQTIFHNESYDNINNLSGLEHSKRKRNKVRNKTVFNGEKLDNLSTEHYENYVIENTADYVIENRVKKHTKIPKTVASKNAIIATRKKPIIELSKRLGKTKIFVEGSGGIRAVSAISKLYPVDNVNIKQGGVEFFIPSKHLQKTVALLNNLCYHYVIGGAQGVGVRLTRSLARVGFVTGLIIVLLAITVYPRFITSIDVNSIDGLALSHTLYQSICDTLESSGIVKGKMSQFDEKEIEKSLLSIDGVAYAQVDRDGTHVSVAIKQELPNEIVDIIGSRVTSSKRAVITRIIVESGTAIKKIGDVVDVNDTIIDGYIEYGNERIPVEAKGYAYGKVYYKERVYFASTEIKKVYGECKSIVKLSMFNKTPKTPDSPYENYECQVSVESFDFLLPFRIYTYTFYEISTIEQERSYTLEQMSDIVYSKMLEKLEPNARVLDKACEYTQVDNGMYVEVMLTVEEML